jgi:hypothetical protein
MTASHSRGWGRTAGFRVARGTVTDYPNSVSRLKKQIDSLPGECCAKYLTTRAQRRRALRIVWMLLRSEGFSTV